MHTLDRRISPRKKMLIHAFASDLADRYDVKCVVRDVSRDGCQIVSSHLDDLPDRIKLVPIGFDRPIYGAIAWRDGKVAGVRFIQNASAGVSVTATAEAPLDYFSRLERSAPRPRFADANGGRQKFQEGGASLLRGPARLFTDLLTRLRMVTWREMALRFRLSIGRGSPESRD